MTASKTQDQAMPRLESTISLGNILSILTIVVGLGASWATMDSRLARNEEAVAEEKRLREIAVAATEARLRSLEVAGATMETQLGNIQTLLERIDLRLERIEGRP